MNKVLEKWEEYVAKLFDEERGDKPEIEKEMEDAGNNERRSIESNK